MPLTTATLIAIAISVALSVASALISSALIKKPKIPEFGDFKKSDDQGQTIRSPAEPRRVVYGETRVGGPIILLEVTSGTTFLHFIVALADHECETIGTVYVDDEPVYPEEIDSNGLVTSGKFSGNLRVKKHLGSDGQEADSDLIAEFDQWTSFHRLRGIAYLYVRLSANREIFGSGVPNISAIVKGKKLEDPRISGGSPSVFLWTNNPALCLRDYLKSGRYGFSSDDSEIDDNFVIAAANICDEIVDTAEVLAIIDLVDFDNDVLFTQFSGTQEPLPFLTGDRVQMTTTGNMYGGVALLTDYYLIVDHERKTPSFKLATSLVNARAGIAIDISDGSPGASGTATVTKNGEPRYTTDGIVRQDVRRGDVLDDILSSMIGNINWSEGRWKMRAGAYVPPVYSFDENDLAGPDGLRGPTKISMPERFNAVKGQFLSPLNFWQLGDFPAVLSDAFKSQDGGEQRFLDIDLKMTTRAAMSQRISKIHLLKMRQEISVSMRVGLRGLLVLPGDTIRLSNTRWGFNLKIFEVATWEIIFDPGNSGAGETAPRISIILGLRETDITSYDFTTSEELPFDPAPNTNLPSGLSVSAPTGLVMASGNNQLFTDNDGTVISRIEVSWTAPSDALITFYELAYKKTSDTSWSRHIVTDVTFFISPVEAGDTYDIEIYSMNSASGAKSLVPLSGQHVVSGKSDLPPDMESFTISRLADGTRQYDWVLATVPADVRSGGGYRIKYETGPSFDWSTATDLHTGLLLASPFESNLLAAGQYTFGIKAVDSTGNESTNAITITATIGDPRLKNVLFERIEQANSWNGTITNGFINPENCIENIGAINGSPTGTWEDLPATWDALSAEWFSVVENEQTLIYETPVIDLGSDLSFTPIIAVIEGDAANHTVVTEIRTATDLEGGISGSPEQSYEIAGPQIGKRYAQIRITITGPSPRVHSMVTLLDGESVEEFFEDVNTSSETNDWFESVATGHFRVQANENLSTISMARINAIQNVGAGYTWELISKSATFGGSPQSDKPAAEFKIYNSSGTLADATVDIELRGPKGS